jgi:hypothetical protein
MFNVSLADCPYICSGGVVSKEGFSRMEDNMRAKEVIDLVAAIAGEEVEFDSSKWGEVVVICQLKSGGTLCWSDIDEERCGVSITSLRDGVVTTLAADLRYVSIEDDTRQVFTN